MIIFSLVTVCWLLLVWGVTRKLALEDVHSLKMQLGWAKRDVEMHKDIANIWQDAFDKHIQTERQTKAPNHLKKLETVGRRRGGVCLAFHPSSGWEVQTAGGHAYMAETPASAIHKATCDHTENDLSLFSVVVRNGNEIVEILHTAPTEKEAARALEELGGTFSDEGPYSIDIEYGVPENQPPAKLKVGDLVVKNPDTFLPNEFDTWGSRAGIGEIVKPPFEVDDLGCVDVRWPGGRCLEPIHGLLKA